MTGQADVPHTELDKAPVSLEIAAMTRERRWMLRVALLVLTLTLVPYLIGWSLSEGRQFMWLGYNLDDSCVYLSWMRQAADGSVRALNLFTTEKQHGMLLNPLFLVLGWFARLTRMPLLAVYHIARLGFGFALLAVVGTFLRQTIANAAARRLAFLCVCFASGLGWLPIPWDILPTSPTCPPAPIDMWQPEAITFLSVYLSPLFCFSMALQVGVLALLFQGERTGNVRYAFAAGICGCVLGLTHTYDILSLSAVWSVYLAVTLFQTRSASNKSGLSSTGLSSKGRASIGRAVFAGAITAPSVAYIYHELKTEALFQQRANVETASALPFWIVLGYGLTLALAIYAIVKTLRRARNASQETEAEDPINDAGNSLEWWATGPDAARLLIVWAVVNVLVSYLPITLFPFQRKMLQGAHFPIAILAGVGLAWGLSLPYVRYGTLRRPVPKFAVSGVLLLLGLSNVRFVARDLSNYQDNRAQSIQRPYLNAGELEALAWVQVNTPSGAAIQPLPWVAVGDRKIAAVDMSLACFAPGLTHHPVYCGHWGETPYYHAKLMELIRFVNPNASDEERINLLGKMKVQYVIFSQKETQEKSTSSEIPFHPFLSDSISVPPYLMLVYSNKDADIYKVDSSVFNPHQ